MNRNTIIHLLLTSTLLSGVCIGRAEAQKSAKPVATATQKTLPILPLLNGEVADYEKVLGVPAFVEENFQNTGWQRRFYKHPLCTRVVLYHNPKATTGPRVFRVQFQFKPGSVKWETAFERFGLSPSQLNRSLYEKKGTVITGLIKEAGRWKDANFGTDVELRWGWYAGWTEAESERDNDNLTVNTTQFPDNEPVLSPTPTAPGKPIAGAKKTPPKNSKSGAAVPSTLPDLTKTLGKDFAAFESYLGQPSDTDFDNTSINKGEIRTYRNPSLQKKGIAQIQLFAYRFRDTDMKGVTSIWINYDKGARPTWQEAVRSVGIAPEALTPHTKTVGISGRATGGKMVTQTQIQFGGLQIPGVEIAGIVEWTRGSFIQDKGFGMQWCESNALNENNPTLQIDYTPVDRFVALPLKDWNNYSQQGGEARFTPLPDGAMEFSVTKPGSEMWHCQAWRVCTGMVEGATYQVAFEAKADAPRSVEVAAQIDAPPYTNIGFAKTIRLGTEFKRYSYLITSDKLNGRPIQVPNFLAGKAVGKITVRNVTVIVMNLN